MNSLGNCDRRVIGLNRKNAANSSEFSRDDFCDAIEKDAFGNKNEIDKREKLFEFTEKNEVCIEDVLILKKNKFKENSSFKKQSILALLDKPYFKKKRRKMYHFDKKT
jgi:hypothetical protein